MKEETKIIIPAAGFGTRARSLGSKELLPLYNQEPIIKKALDASAHFGYRSHVITRSEKLDLIAFLESFPHADMQIINPSREWPDSILQSAPFWASKNIILLPDTLWSPLDLIERISLALDQAQVVPATFSPSDLSSWGVFKTHQDYFELCEKPSDGHDHATAWGILGFRKEAGEELFKAILESSLDHMWKKTKLSFKPVTLEHFEDVTRL